MKNVTDIYPDRVEEREATESEITAREELASAVEARQMKDAELETLKQSARAKLVAGEPLTAEEAATLVI